MKMQLLFFSALVPMFAFAAPTHWFGGRDVDWWNEGRMVRGGASRSSGSETDLLSKLPVTDSIIRSADFLPFDWNNYTNPMSPTFWDDGGNYVPPLPLRQLAAFKTPENLARYKEWQRLKNQTIADLGVMLASDNASVPAENSTRDLAQLQRNSPGERDRRGSFQNGARHNIEWSKVTATFVYSSSCLHCRREIPIIERLKTQGAKVIALQLNSESEKPIISESVPLSQTDAQRLEINVTPTLLLTANGKSVRIEGYAPESQLADEVIKLF